MLVLSRHRDETIVIGSDVKIIVVDIRGDKVRLGIEAPPELPIHRLEVFEAIQREQRKAAKSPPIPFGDVPSDLAPLGERGDQLSAASRRLTPLAGQHFDIKLLPVATLTDMWKLAQAYMKEHGGGDSGKVA